MGFSRQEYWSVLPYPDTGVELCTHLNPNLKAWAPGPQQVFTNMAFREVTGVSRVAQFVKNLPAMQETQVHSLNGEDAPEKEMSTHSSILA